MAKETVQKSLGSQMLSRPGRARPPNQSTALVVDGELLRVVQAASSGKRAKVTRVAAAPLEIPPEADAADPKVLGLAISHVLERLRIKPSSVVMGVPRAKVVLRTLTLPMLEDVREIASMVHLQIGKDLPFPVEEAVIDFKVRRTPSLAPARPEPNATPDAPGLETASLSPKLEVLVAAVKRDLVTTYQQTAAAAGLKLSALGLMPYANARSLDAFHLVEGEQATALVSLRPDEMNIDVIAEQTLLFSRGARVKSPAEPAVPGEGPAPEAEAQPSAAVTEEGDAASFVNAVTIEVVRSLHGFSGMEPSRPVARVAVTGATGHEAAVVKAIEKRVTGTCSVLDSSAMLALPAEAREHAPASLATIGLALGLADEAGLPFDFLNPKRPAVQRDMRRIRILASIAAAVAFLVFTMAVRRYLIHKHEIVRGQLAAEFAEAKKKLPIYRQMTRQANTVSEWADGGRNWLEHYAYLSAILPPSEEVYITSLSVSGASAIRLSVQARSGEILAKLDKELRAAGYEVKPLAIAPGVDRHGYEFRSSVELLVPEEMSINLSKVKAQARPADDVSLKPTFNQGGGR